MSDSSAIRIVHPSQFDKGTLQTPGSEREAAIAPQLGIQSMMWGGLFEVKPGARTGIHHHGVQQTIAYVLSGVCEVRWGLNGEFAASAEAAISFTFQRSCSTWKSIRRVRDRSDGWW
jgi:uncharacterized RmlC-like cupin family protein